nr:unnamed protein product [Digitaria exilis]
MGSRTEVAVVVEDAAAAGSPPAAAEGPAAAANGGEEGMRMEGWLYLIRSNRFGLQYSRKRYFVLEDAALRCFKSAPSSKREDPVRSAVIDSCIRVTDNGRESVHRSEFYIFTLYNASNHYDQLKLGARSSEEAARWIRCLMESALKSPRKDEHVVACSHRRWQAFRLSRRNSRMHSIDWTLFSSAHNDPMASDVIAPSPWTIFGCKNGLRLFTEANDGSSRGKYWDDHPAIMAVGVVDANSEAVFQTLMSLGQSRSEGMRKRDLLLRRYWRREDDGTYALREFFRAKNGNCACMEFSSGELTRDMGLPQADEFFDVPDESEYDQREIVFPSDESTHAVIKANNTLMQMVGADWIKSDKREDDLAGRPGGLVQKYAAQGGTKFFFIVNIQVPGSTTYSLALYYMMDTPLEKVPLLERFVNGDDAFRNSRFKLIPYISKGSWIVKQSVGKKACLVGQALEINYFRGSNYLELGVDIGSSTVARGVVSLVLGYLNNLVIEMAFLVQGNTYEELPEFLLGTCRLNYLDASKAVSIDEC